MTSGLDADLGSDGYAIVKLLHVRVAERYAAARPIFSRCEAWSAALPASTLSGAQVAAVTVNVDFSA